MAKSSRMPENVREMRLMAKSEHAPEESYQRTAYKRGNSLYANLPERAVENMNLNAGDDIVVHVHRDRVVVELDEA